MGSDPCVGLNTHMSWISRSLLRAVLRIRIWEFMYGVPPLSLHFQSVYYSFTYPCIAAAISNVRLTQLLVEEKSSIVHNKLSIQASQNSMTCYLKSW